MDEFLAHSAGDNHPAQSYVNHISNVVKKAGEFAGAAQKFCTSNDQQLQNVVVHSSEYHDVGKLEPDNQAELHKSNSKKSLPKNHVDAGAAFMEREGAGSIISKMLVYSHHRGLPDVVNEEIREMAIFRDESSQFRASTDKALDSLVKVHRQVYPKSELHFPEEVEVDFNVFSRLALSCLADADHTDTAIACSSYPVGTQETVFPELLPEKRLEALDNYVYKLGNGDERSVLRSQVYQCCRDYSGEESIVSCSSPVGTGKTTAIMAHLLRKATEIGARHIFVVLPFTNIITQSVEKYRKALVLPGENPEYVVAELHHKADFESEGLRLLSALWRAPIIVTTAVSFFETLASNKTSTLRKLHELPGSVIFVDEAHASVPVNLLPVTWQWMQILADEWSCHWVLASGSLVRFWEIEEISEEIRTVPELIDAELTKKLSVFEAERIHYQWIPEPQSREMLIDRIFEQPGPRLVIMNTVKSAAVIANDIRNQKGSGSVLHLSTALTPNDRENIIKRIKERLADELDSDWALVATSCVEAGVDFSFKTGFRELSSILSLLQASGRVNRGGKDKGSPMFCFTMQDDPMLKTNPGVKYAGRILERFFEKGMKICPELSTKAICNEIREYGNKQNIDLLAVENESQFATVEKNYHIIDSQTSLAVANPEIAAQIKYGLADWRVLQKNSVSVYGYNLDKWGIPQIKDGLYEWTLKYDSFLGYMAGVLEYERSKGGFLCL